LDFSFYQNRNNLNLYHKNDEFVKLPRQDTNPENQSPSATAVANRIKNILQIPDDKLKENV
jgi:hypothetical protein